MHSTHRVLLPRPQERRHRPGQAYRHEARDAPGDEASDQDRSRDEEHTLRDSPQRKADARSLPGEHTRAEECQACQDRKAHPWYGLRESSRRQQAQEAHPDDGRQAGRAEHREELRARDAPRIDRQRALEELPAAAQFPEPDEPSRGQHEEPGPVRGFQLALVPQKPESRDRPGRLSAHEGQHGGKENEQHEEAHFRALAQEHQDHESLPTSSTKRSSSEAARRSSSAITWRSTPSRSAAAGPRSSAWASPFRRRSRRQAGSVRSRSAKPSSPAGSRSTQCSSCSVSAAASKYTAPCSITITREARRSTSCTWCEENSTVVAPSRNSSVASRNSRRMAGSSPLAGSSSSRSSGRCASAQVSASWRACPLLRPDT